MKLLLELVSPNFSYVIHLSVFLAMPEPSAAVAAEPARKKRNASGKQPAKKRMVQGTIASSLLVPRTSVTSVAFSKKGLPTPVVSKGKNSAPIKPASSNWVREQFVDFFIVEQQDDSGAKVRVKEPITEEFPLQQSLV